MSSVFAVLLKVSRSRAPRMTGLALRLFVSFVESPFSSPLYAKLLRDSGIPQVRSPHTSSWLLHLLLQQSSAIAGHPSAVSFFTMNLAFHE